MILGTKARYAVMALVDLADRNTTKPVTLADIAGAQDIPLAYLEQIFMKLKKSGLVRSVRGPGGGYVLAHPPARTWIADIVHAVDESLKITQRERQDSPTHALWHGLSHQMYAYLRAISLDDVRRRRLPNEGACAIISKMALINHPGQDAHNH